MALESLDIRVRQQGARTVARDIRNIGFAASAVSGQLSTTSRLLRGLAIASVARRIFAFADSFTNLSNRVRLFTDSQESANRTTNELINIANRARVATDAVSLTFQRLAINQDRLGLSTERVLKLTETLSKAVAIGGSSAQEAGGALRQFSQALSGNFQAAAQELNSVLEQTPGLAAALADGLGISTDRIKVLAREGKLNSDIVIKALESQADVIEARFSRIAPTIGQAFQVLTNSTEVLVGQFFRVSDVGKTITSSLIALSQRMLQLALDEDRLNEILNRTVDLFKLLIAIKAAQFFFSVARAVDAVVVSSLRLQRVNLFGTFVRLPAILASIVTGLGGVRVGLLALIASNPFTILLAAVTAFLGLLFSVRNETVTLGGETVRVQDVIVAGFEIIVEKTRAWIDRMLEATKVFRDLLPTARQFFNSVIAGFTIVGRIVGEVFGAIVTDATEGLRVIGQKILDLIDATARATEGDFKGAFDTLFAPVPVAAESAFSQIDFGKIFREEGQRDFLQEATTFFESVFGPELAERAAARFRESFVKAAPNVDQIVPVAPGVGIGTTFALTEQQKAVTDLVAAMDVGVRVALEYLEAQTELDKAVKAGVITQKEQAAIIKQLATNDFRRLAAETDELASLTIDYNDRLAELNARAQAAGLQGTAELNDAIARQRVEFEAARFEIRRYQESLTATEAVQEGVTTGFRRFTEGLGTIASNVADLTEDLLNRSLDAVHELTTKGTLDFRQFALDAIAEIQKVILKMLALRVIQGLGGGGQPGGASTETGAGNPLLGIVGEILGGARGGKGNTGGSAADPLFVQIIGAGQVGADATKGITEAIGIQTQDQAARDQQKTATEAGFFANLLSGIGNAVSGIFDTIGGLFTNGFNTVTRGLGQLGSFIGSGLSSLASGLGGAISSLVGLFGGGGGDTTSQVLGLVGSVVGIAGGLQTGGSLGASDIGKSFLVGEAGPELFVPKQTGTVVPNEALAAMQPSAPPPVNVQVVNVDDPTTVPNAMSTREGEQVILNVIQRNRGKLRQIIS